MPRHPAPAAPRRRRIAARAAALSLAVVLGTGGCATESGSGSSADPSAATEDGTGHNAADVRFATDMIQHHAQALAMVDLTQGRPLKPKVLALVEGIRDAQAPEIELMADWLTDWGEPVPATVRDHEHAGHDMADGEMPGMMSAEQMAGLEAAADADFSELWLAMMIEHHQGAVEMAATQLDEGQFRPALDLAEQIDRTQTDEIARMQQLLS